jgi:hypothetical protein
VAGRLIWHGWLWLWQWQWARGSLGCGTTWVHGGMAACLRCSCCALPPEPAPAVLPRVCHVQEPFNILPLEVRERSVGWANPA